jgi:hypothetical protein
MSDETKPRNDQDPAAQVAAELRARLRAMPHDALIDLAAQLTTTYVIEGVLPLARAGESAELAADTVGEETFAQLVKRLQAARKDPVLDRFIIDGENISVRIDGQGVMPLTEYRRPNAPPGAPQQPRRESVPGASTSIYNRALYQPEQPAPTRNAPPQPAQPAPAPGGIARTPQPGAPVQQAPQQGKKDEPRSDRFALIELD